MRVYFLSANTFRILPRESGSGIRYSFQNMPPKRSFLNALKWAYSANWGEKAFSSVFTFALAAMLGPRTFGVISLALIYIAFVQMLLNQGLMAALIQKRVLKAAHLNTVFWTNFGFSLGLVGLSLLLSGWWARLNHLSEL